MSFTQEDCIKEVVLKTMASLSWQKSDPINAKERLTTIHGWLVSLAIEGPEKERISRLLRSPVDEAQKDLFLSELRALLVFDGNRQLLRKVIERALKRKPSHNLLEKKLLGIIEGLLANERSDMETMICQKEEAEISK